MRSKAVGVIVLAVTAGILYGCARPILLTPNKKDYCKPDKATVKEAALYLTRLIDNRVLAAKGIFLSSDYTSEHHARCLDQILRDYGDGRYGIIRHEDDYLAIEVMY